MARRAAGDPAPPPGEELPAGVRLGLPTTGRGSVSGWGRRFLGLAVDWAVALLIGQVLLGGVVGRDLGPLLVFFALHALLVSTLGMTIGHAVTGTAVRRTDAPVVVGFGRGIPRAVLLCLVVPAIVWDQDRRGLHDRAASTVVVRR